MVKFSTSWKSSVKPTKQRNYLRKAPLHIKGNFLHAHLSEELSKKHGKRALRIRKGDKAKVMVGEFKGKIGKVEEVDTKNLKVFIAGVEVQKSEGNKIRIPISVSNVMITELDLSDKRRQEILKRK